MCVCAHVHVYGVYCVCMYAYTLVRIEGVFPLDYFCSVLPTGRRVPKWGLPKC